MAITAKDVQALREKTGVGMMDCKKALTEAEGDFDRAIDILRERGLAEGDLIDIVATSRDGSERSVHAFRALGYNMPRGSAAGYMPELNVLIGAADYSTQSDQPLMKSIRVRITAVAGERRV